MTSHRGIPPGGAISREFNRGRDGFEPSPMKTARRNFPARESANCSSSSKPAAANSISGGKFNAAYREGDSQVHAIPDSAGKRVLELGCGRGDLLAALEPSYGVGVDFSARTIARARELHPHLHFVLGDVEDPATLAAIEGPFDYIVIADTIGMFEDIDGTLRLVHQSVRAVDADHHRLLLASVGADPEARRDVETQEPADRDQLHRHRRFPEPDGSGGFRGDQPGADGN